MGRLEETTTLSMLGFCCVKRTFSYNPPVPPLQNERMTPEKGPFQNGKHCFPFPSFFRGKLAVGFSGVYRYICLTTTGWFQLCLSFT